MKVVHLVTTTAFAGVERYLTYVARAQAQAGLAVVVLGGDRERMAAAFDGSGVQHHAARPGPRTWARIRRSDTDVIHAHMTHAELVAVIASHGRPVVATRHFARRRGTSVLGRAAARYIAPRLAAEVAISRFVADSVGGAVEIVPNGVPEAPMGAHAEPVVLVAQRLEAEKDTATALRAWARSGLAEAGWRLVVAGQGAEQNQLEGLARELGIDHSVRMAGFVDDLQAEMAEAAVLLATAPAEPFGLTIAEAMACGLPVVAACGGSHLETVGRVTPDALFRAGDAHGAAGVLRAVALDEDRRRAAGAALQAYQREELGLAAHVERLGEVYQAVLSRGPRRT
jgi:glycosyltransferase involved in cell wall biosynthesis